jgi:DNA end-binding protein Ku
MPRAIWSGSISFGLLNVPVKLYSATSKQTVRFKELREGDGSRIRHKRVAEEDGKEVPYEKIVKGYEISPEQYVILTREELEELDPKRTRAIEIQDFVDLDEIDPIYFDQPYYLGPDAGAEKAYRLLVQAMEDERKVAVARFVLRNKEHLAAIRPMNGVMTMATMRFADEVVDPSQLDEVLGDDDVKVDKREVEMAKKLIDSLASDFDADKYHDEYREELLDLIERKAKGEDVVVAQSEEPTPTKAPDLMSALEESLAAVRGEELAGDAAADGDGAAKPKKATKSSRSKSSAKAKSSSKSKSSSGKSSKTTKPKSRSRAKAGSKK